MWWCLSWSMSSLSSVRLARRRRRGRSVPVEVCAVADVLDDVAAAGLRAARRGEQGRTCGRGSLLGLVDLRACRLQSVRVDRRTAPPVPPLPARVVDAVGADPPLPDELRPADELEVLDGSSSQSLNRWPLRSRRCPGSPAPGRPAPARRGPPAAATPVSIVASCWPAVTCWPTETSTVATVPDIGQPTVTSPTRAAVPLRLSVCRTVPEETRAVRYCDVLRPSPGKPLRDGGAAHHDQHRGRQQPHQRQPVAPAWKEQDGPVSHPSHLRRCCCAPAPKHDPFTGARSATLVAVTAPVSLVCPRAVAHWPTATSVALALTVLVYAVLPLVVTVTGAAVEVAPSPAGAIRASVNDAPETAVTLPKSPPAPPRPSAPPWPGPPVGAPLGASVDRGIPLVPRRRRSAARTRHCRCRRRPPARSGRRPAATESPVAVAPPADRTATQDPTVTSAALPASWAW